MSDVQTTLQTFITAFNDNLTKVNELIKIIEIYGYNSTLKTVVNNSDEYSNVRQNALVLIGSIIPTIIFTTSTDAENLKDELSYIFDAESYFITDRQLFTYFNDLQASIQTVLSENGFGLPELITYTTKNSLPAALISQNLYGDGSYDDDIIQRNNENVIHPLFMPLSLTVLSGVENV
ncbi:hypothetical protein [Novacetimonas hansenii]|uniref:Uncharacterized protein n=1 Tax=Novacetimonas hansenii TaxID=436 RepID=A0ABQ0SHG8_NOVHA|nr:hypothetical protein [Novacetimonas hansenii]GAN84022.1 hypothetical protein Gaha_0122_022 [Novacetimonas hansenii JCM 7643]GBQ55787.1 hypothetical protein AA0243_1010 [Novacetimonas hansenii NRIC 0243]GEC64602.1 hypothetical protein GHA01_24510 [Novacetimonas hansenii]